MKLKFAEELYQTFGKIVAITIGILLFQLIAAAQVNTLSITDKKSANTFPVVSNKGSSIFYYDPKDAAVVKIAAAAFVQDVKDITKKQITLSTETTLPGGYIIIAGTIGQSKIIDELIKDKLIDVSDIKNKWEHFTIKIIKTSSKVKGSPPPFGG